MLSRISISKLNFFDDITLGITVYEAFPNIFLPAKLEHAK